MRRISFRLNPKNERAWHRLREQCDSMMGKKCSTDEVINIALESVVIQFNQLEAIVRGKVS